MRSRKLRRRLSIAVGIAFTSTALVVSTIGAPAGAGGSDDGPGHDDGKGNDAPVLFFVADGMRQDLVEQFSATRTHGRSDLPAFAELLKKGSSASGGGLLTEAPPNTGAGWYSLATGAWPGVHGSTNNTFHVNGQPFGNSTSAFNAGVPQAESIGQSAERGGKKVVQFEYAGGAETAIQGPTVDFRTFHSGRGVATNYISPNDAANFVAAFGVQFDHPAGFAGQAAFPGAAPVDAAGWTNTPQSFSPAKEMRLRVLDFGNGQVRPQRVPLRQHRRRSRQLRQGAVLADQGRQQQRRHARPGRVGRCEGQDLRWRARRQDGRVPREGRDPHGGPVPGAALPHVRRPRHRLVADLAGRARLLRHLRRIPRPDVPELDRRRLRRARVGRRQRGDLRRAGAEVGDLRDTRPDVHHAGVPARPRARRLPDDRRVPAPVPRTHRPEAAQRCTPTRPTTTCR